jgi:hydrogenase small subunit
MLNSLITTATALETIDERLLRCGISRRSFLVFCSSLMIAAPYGLAITDKKTPEEVAAGLGKTIRPPVIWLLFQDCTGCTESLLQTSHPDFGDLILNIISLEYHETLMAGSGAQARQALDEAVKKYSGKFILVVEGSIPTKDSGVYMKLAGRPALEVLADISGRHCGHRIMRVLGRHPVCRPRSNRRRRRSRSSAQQVHRQYPRLPAEPVHVAWRPPAICRRWNSARGR